MRMKSLCIVLGCAGVGTVVASNKNVGNLHTQGSFADSSAKIEHTYALLSSESNQSKSKDTTQMAKSKLSMIEQAFIEQAFKIIESAVLHQGKGRNDLLDMVRSLQVGLRIGLHEKHATHYQGEACCYSIYVESVESNDEIQSEYLE